MWAEKSPLGLTTARHPSEVVVTSAPARSAATARRTMEELEPHPTDAAGSAGEVAKAGLRPVGAGMGWLKKIPLGPWPSGKLGRKRPLVSRQQGGHMRHEDGLQAEIYVSMSGS